jgi:hypothetical protein
MLTETIKQTLKCFMHLDVFPKDNVLLNVLEAQDALKGPLGRGIGRWLLGSGMKRAQMVVAAGCDICAEALQITQKPFCRLKAGVHGVDKIATNALSRVEQHRHMDASTVC